MLYSLLTVYIYDIFTIKSVYIIYMLYSLLTVYTYDILTINSAYICYIIHVNIGS